MKRLALAFIFTGFVASTGVAKGEDEPAANAEGLPPAEGAASEGSSSAAVTPNKPVSNRGRRFREKEAEGSQAPNRFEADNVVRSKYHINGQPLEVDPD